MNKAGKVEETVSQVREAVKEAVERGEDIGEKVKKITVDALSEGQIDMERIKAVIRSVWDGAKAGIGKDGAKVKSAFGEVMSGLDDALEKTAYASKLAIEETAGKFEKFSQEDLRRTLDDLQGLESLLLETITEAAKNSKEMVADTLNDLVKHAKNSGTEVGARVAQELEGMRANLAKLSKESLSGVGEAASSFGADVARAASGFLAGLADSIKPPKK